MVHKSHFTVDYTILDNDDELSDSQLQTVLAAQQALLNAYAPYSGFRVGAALLLENGTIVAAANKENASFPAGTCAERNALHQSSDRFPAQRILKLAIAAESARTTIDKPPSPCGICRQVMIETEINQETPIEVIMYAKGCKTVVVESCGVLLPLHFYLAGLRK